MVTFKKDRQYAKFCAYGFLKNLRFFDAFLILFLLEKGMSYTEIGTLYAAREIFIHIFEIPSGIIADTYGRKHSLLGSFIIYIISFLIYYISNDFWLILVAFILYGIADAFRSGTHKGMIMDYLKLNGWHDQKINYYGHTRSWSQKGSALSALIGGLIVFHSDSYENIFLFSVIPYLFNLAVVASYPKEINHAKNKKKGHKESIKATFTSFWEIIRKPKVLQIINTSAIYTAYLRAVKDYIQPLLLQIALLIPFMMDWEANKKNSVVISLIYFVIYLANSRASQLAGKVESGNKKDIPYLSLLLGFGGGILCGTFYYLGFWWLSLLAFVALYLLESLRKPILTGYISDQVPNKILTSVLSVQSLLKTISTAILALAFGVMADAWGIGISFVGISGLLLVLAVGIRFMTVKSNTGSDGLNK